MYSKELKHIPKWWRGIKLEVFKLDCKPAWTTFYCSHLCMWKRQVHIRVLMLALMVATNRSLLTLPIYFWYVLSNSKVPLISHFIIIYTLCFTNKSLHKPAHASSSLHQSLLFFLAFCLFSLIRLSLLALSFCSTPPLLSISLFSSLLSFSLSVLLHLFSNPGQCGWAVARGSVVSGWLPLWRCTSERCCLCGSGFRPPKG